MNCTCPKCHAAIELDLPEVTEEGVPSACPECKSHLFVHRESFGGRALRKTGEISCAQCGNELGPSTHCSACGAQFPDYVVVSQGRKRTGRARAKVQLKTSPFPKMEGRKLPKIDFGLGRDVSVAPAAKKFGAKSRKGPQPLVLAGALLVLVAVVSFGIMFYLKNKEEGEYSSNFVKATYAIQTLAVRSLKASDTVSAEWKAKLDTGQSFVPRIGADDERSINIVNTEVGLLLNKMSKPPERFKQCNSKIEALNAASIRLQSFALVPSGSLQNFVDSRNKLEGEYSLAVKKFKAGMPPEMMDDLRTASKRLKALKAVVD